MAYYYSPFRKQYDEDFHSKKKVPSDTCVFCDTEVMETQGIKNKNAKLIENEHYKWVVNYFPQSEGHTLIIPKRHVTRIGHETPEEIIARERIVVFATDMLQKLYPGAGVEIFIQNGGASRASIAHLHWHVVPAQKSDPFRGFEKFGLFYTIDKEQEKVILFPVEIQKAQDGLQRELAEIIGDELPCN